MANGFSWFDAQRAGAPVRTPSIMSDEPGAQRENADPFSNSTRKVHASD